MLTNEEVAFGGGGDAIALVAVANVPRNSLLAVLHWEPLVSL